MAVPAASFSSRARIARASLSARPPLRGFPPLSAPRVAVFAPFFPSLLPAPRSPSPSRAGGWDWDWDWEWECESLHPGEEGEGREGGGASARCSRGGGGGAMQRELFWTLRGRMAIFPHRHVSVTYYLLPSTDPLPLSAAPLPTPPFHPSMPARSFPPPPPPPIPN